MMPSIKHNFDLNKLTPKQLAHYISCWPKALSSLTAIVDSSLKKENVNQLLLVEKILTDVAFYVGGREIYIPVGDTLLKFLCHVKVARKSRKNTLPITLYTEQSFPEFKGRWVATLPRLIYALENRLQIEGIEPFPLIETILADLAHYFGGRQYYIPKGSALVTYLRNIQIYQEFKGFNSYELATQYELSVRQVDNIVADMRQLNRV